MLMVREFGRAAGCRDVNDKTAVPSPLRPTVDVHTLNRYRASKSARAPSSKVS